MRRLIALMALAAAASACGSAPASRTTSVPTYGSTSSGAQVAAPRATSSAAAPCGWRTTTTYRHVIWIWMENRTFSSVVTPGSQVAAYAGRCGLATGYYAVTHPSLPNYLAATSGSTGGVTSDCAPASCAQRRASLFGQLQAAGTQWRSYVESMPSACDQAASGSYAPKHNPAAYFTPVRSRCRVWDVPMGGAHGAFAAALANRTLAPFTFVTPNMCDDGHDCPTSTADRWAGTWLGRIVASAAYRAGDTAVFLTWDEGVGSAQRIATVVVAPTVARGTRSSTRFTHYSLLRTTEELLGLPRLGAATTARSMRAAFRL
jgi:hypothetical protein